MKIPVLNNRGININLLHFQGTSMNDYKKTTNFIYKNIDLDPIENDLEIASCWTDEYKCILYNQLKKNNIELINVLPKNYDYSKQWDMRNKIRYYIDYLRNTKSKYIILLDGYDVLFVNTNNIISKFESYGYDILFNSSHNRYPDEEVEVIENREEKLGFFQYFNAGCCIGYRESLLKFYLECLNYINIENPNRSEQLIVRKAFAKYSNDDNQRFIWVDNNRDIFHTMCYTKVNYDANTNILQIDNFIKDEQ